MSPVKESTLRKKNERDRKAEAHELVELFFPSVHFDYKNQTRNVQHTETLQRIFLIMI